MSVLVIFNNSFRRACITIKQFVISLQTIILILFKTLIGIWSFILHPLVGVLVAETSKQLEEHFCKRLNDPGLAKMTNFRTREKQRIAAKLLLSFKSG